MKLSFSTLGCPDWTFDEILEYGRKYGFEGVGFRGVKGQMDLTRIPEFAPERRKETVKRLSTAGLAPMMMLTSVKFALSEAAERQKNLEDAKANINLAAAMGSPSIRVFGGKIPEGVKKEAAYGWVAENL